MIQKLAVELGLIFVAFMLALVAGSVTISGQSKSFSENTKVTSELIPELKVNQLSTEWDDWVYSDDSRVFAYSVKQSSSTQLMDLSTRKTIATLPFRGSLAVSGDGSSVAIGTLKGEIVLWDGKGLNSLMPKHKTEVSAIDITPDGHWLVSGDTSGVLNFWDGTTGKAVWSINVHDKIQALALSSDGSRVLVCWGTGALYGAQSVGSGLFDGKTGQLVKKLDKNEGYGVIAGHMSDDGNIAATIRDLSTGVTLWNARSGKNFRLLPNETIAYMTLSADGKKLAALNDHGNLLLVDTEKKTSKLIDTSTGPFQGFIKKLQFVRQDEVFAVAVFGYGSVFLSSKDGSVVESLTETRTPIPMDSVKTSMTNPFLVGQSRYIASLWDFRTGRLRLKEGSGYYSEDIARIPLPGALAVPCEFQSTTISPDETVVAGVTCEGTLVVFPLSGGEKREFTGFHGKRWFRAEKLSFSPNGRYLICVGVMHSTDNRLMIWDRWTDTLREVPLEKKLVTASGFDEKEQRAWLLLGRNLYDSFKGYEYLTINLSTGSIERQDLLEKANCDWVHCGSEGTTISPRGRFAAYWSFDPAECRLRDLAGKDELLLPETSQFGYGFAPKFSCDEKLVLYGNAATGPRLYDLDQKLMVWNKSFKDLLGFSPKQVDVGFSCKDRSLLILADGRLFGIAPSYPELGTDRVVEYKSSRGELKSFSEILGKNIVAAPNSIGIDIFDQTQGKRLLNIMILDEGPWIVTTPDGRFDTQDPEGLGALSWIMPDERLRPLPIDIFMRDYYEPRLLPRLLRGEKLPPIPSLAGLNRNQPKVDTITVLPKKDGSGLVDVKVKVSSVAGQCLRESVKVSCESGVYDLRLYRDDQIVGKSPGSGAGQTGSGGVTQTRQEFIRDWRAQTLVKTVSGQSATVKSGPQEILFENIQLPKRADVSQVKITAYAFNEDRVKSATSAPIMYKLPEPRPANVQRRAYVITVGVNLTDASNWSLLFAPNGATDIDKLLKQQLKSKYEVVPVQLISEPGKTSEELNTFQATSGNIQTVLDILGGKEVSPERRKALPENKLQAATPDDLVVVYIASHGYANPKGMFYIVPSDIGDKAQDVSEELLNRCLTTNEQSLGCSAAMAFLERSISSEELSEWLEGIDAGEMTLILDSCHSASVAGPNFKPGPMGDRGFGQLSYDKGMRVLAASQAEKPAWGTLILKDRSLLTYVLTRPEAIGQQFDMKFWLNEAERRVPEIYDREVPNERQRLQEPLLFDFVRKYRS